MFRLIAATIVLILAVTPPASATVTTDSGFLRCTTFTRRELRLEGFPEEVAFIFCHVSFDDGCTIEVQAIPFRRRTGKRVCTTAVTVDTCVGAILSGIDECGVFK